jgi:hypothetical protein
MENKYGKDKYTFFREGTSALQLIEESKYFNGKVRDLHQELEYQIDMFNNDSCDVYSLCGS